MKRLAPETCVALLRALADGVTGIGPMKALRAFAAEGDFADHRCAASIAELLEAGRDFSTALALSQPQLPLAIESLLALAAQQGRLDEALTDLLACLTTASHEDVSLLQLDLLEQEWEARADSPFICQACLERELQKIIMRSKTEGADKVILQQEGARFLHQKYLAVKLVHIIEASHAKTFATLEEQLSRLAESGDGARIESVDYAIRPQGEREYLLVGPEGFTLRLEFRPWQPLPGP